MWSQNSSLGFYKTPVTKGLLTSVGLVSTILVVLGPRYQRFFAYTTESLTERFELWRLVTSKVVFIDPRNIFLGLLLLYNFRIFEKRYGSTKYASCLLATGVLTTVMELAALLTLQRYQGGGIPIHWAPGPTGVIVSLFVPYIWDVPYLSAQNMFGQLLNGKWFAYILGLQLMAQSTQSAVVIGCGLLSGLLYRANALRLQSWLRVPGPVARLAAALLGPLLRAGPPREGAVPMGATLEIQRQQRMELMEQQMMLAQARQFQEQMRSRGTAASTSASASASASTNSNSARPTISSPLAGGPSGNLAAMFGQQNSQGNHSGDIPDTMPGSAPGPSQPGTSTDSTPVPEERVLQLTDMGFNRSAAVQALKATKNDVNMATNLLIQEG